MGDPVRRQIALDLGHEPGLSRDDLMVSAANRAAVALVERWPDWPAPVVVLVGPTGSGKSHLAAIWQAASGARPLNSADLGALNIDREHGAILIDDLDRGAVDEAGLFHLINTVRAGGGHLLVTARSAPRSWPIALPDLRSRLVAATTVLVEAPDDALLAAVLTKLFADRQIEVEPAVIDFITRRMERSLASAGGIVERLDRLALERKTRITRSLAGVVLGTHQHGDG